MEPKNLTGNYGPNFLEAQVKGAQNLHSRLWARKMGGLSKWNQKNLTGNYGPNFLKAQVKGAQKLHSRLWARKMGGLSKWNPKT